ncbi:hypothetical protein ACQKWADRAFT_193381 [Trichoderma austrokoningii]
MCSYTKAEARWLSCEDDPNHTIAAIIFVRCPEREGLLYGCPRPEIVKPTEFPLDTEIVGRICPICPNDGFIVFEVEDHFFIPDRLYRPEEFS